MQTYFYLKKTQNTRSMEIVDWLVVYGLQRHFQRTCMIKARSKYPTDLHSNIYIDNIQKAVVICLIIPTIFPFHAGSSDG